MPDHAAYLDRFAHAIVTPAEEPPLFEGPHARVRAGLDVYRNNVFHSLGQALGDIYPVVKDLVGDEFFKAMARDFAREEPPSGPVLAEYGTNFPAFLERFPPVRPLPYLADIARLERAWLEAFHSADAPPLDARLLEGMTEEQSGALVFQVHPATRGVASRFPVLTIWGAHQRPGEMPEINLDLGAEEAVITRPRDAVTVWRMPPGTCAFLYHISQGLSLGAAYEAVSASRPGFDLGTALGLLIQAGAFAADARRRGNDG